MVWDGEHLAYWERSRGQTMQNIEENPQVCILYRNPVKRIAWKLFGTGRVLHDGELRMRIMERTIDAELQRDPERKGAAVLIRVDRVVQGGQVIMARE